jgi:chaperonin GroES
MDVYPLNDRVVIRRAEPAAVTAGGIHIPTTSQDKTEQGTVVGIGPKVEEVTYGDLVVFGKYSGTEIAVNGETFLVLRVDDVVAVLR